MQRFFQIFKERIRDKILVWNTQLFDTGIWDLLLLQTVETNIYTAIEVAMIWFMKFVMLTTAENDWYRSYDVDDEQLDSSLCDQEYFDIRSLKSFYPVFEFEDYDMDRIHAKSVFGYFKSLDIYPEIFKKYEIETTEPAVVKYFGDDAKITLKTKKDFEEYAAFEISDCYIEVFDILFAVANSYIRRHEMMINAKRNNTIIVRNNKL